jgi:hypothetical protein
VDRFRRGPAGEIRSKFLFNHIFSEGAQFVLRRGTIGDDLRLVGEGVGPPPILCIRWRAWSWWCLRLGILIRMFKTLRTQQVALETYAVGQRAAAVLVTRLGS